MWGSSNTFGRGKMIENIIINSNLNYLNTGSSTYFHIQTGTLSSIDLSICNPELSTYLTWKTLESLYGSNHFPILISNNDNSQRQSQIKWKITHADWDLFNLIVKEQRNEISFMNSADEDLNMLINCIITSAEKCIGKYYFDPSKKYVPWWNESCKLAVKDCKKALNRYRETRNQADLINLRKLRAKSKRIVKESKKNSWNKYISSITSDTPSSQIWTKIKQMKGRYTTYKIPAIIENNNVITDDQQIINTLAKYY
ncbi:uncharacterized protein [Diabrotica undecimpunctata]|uniref:uncharacterized protein n=1 Tax=Diabrotica undecimpunctata TaxID=50387 RepID=UPI003B6365D8